MTSEELFVVTITLLSALLALTVYLQAKISRPGKVSVARRKAGWAMFSLSAAFLCTYQFLRFDSSDHFYALAVITLSLCLTIFGIYRFLYPTRKKQIDDSRRLERYMEEFGTKRDTVTNSNLATGAKKNNTLAGRKRSNNRSRN